MNESPDMNDSRWAWVAFPVWWLVVAFYYVKDLFRRKT